MKGVSSLNQIMGTAHMHATVSQPLPNIIFTFTLAIYILSDFQLVIKNNNYHCGQSSPT